MTGDPAQPVESEDDAIRRTIDALEREGKLDPLQTTFVRDRWLGQLQWFERKAGKHQREMNVYRVVLLAGGVALPVVVNLAATRSDGWIEVAAVVLSLVVGFVAGLDAFRRPGERWLRYRQTAEQLRAEWWRYVNLVGDEYTKFATVSDAFRTFVVRVQAIIEQDVSGYVAIVRQSMEPDDGREPPAAPVTPAGGRPGT